MSHAIRTVSPRLYVHVPSWLTPRGLFCLIPLPLLAIISSFPEAYYPKFWSEPNFIDTAGWFSLILTSTLLVVSLSGVRNGSKSKEIIIGPNLAARLVKLANVLFWLAAICYLAWLAFAIARGFRLNTLLEIIQGDTSSLLATKYTYFAKVSGVTTWVQLAVPAGSLLAIARFLQPRKKTTWKIISLVSFALVRSFILAEREALIEIILAIGVTMVLIKPGPGGSKFRYWQVFLSAWASLPLFFGGYEFFRSWSAYYGKSGGNFSDFVVQRLAGYYATALNNGFLSGLRLDFSTNLSLLFHINLFGSGTDDQVPSLLFNYANPEFNNVSGLVLPLVTFGLPLGLLFLFLWAKSINKVFSSAQSGSLSAVILYACTVVSILEILRFFYVGDGRFVAIFISVIYLAVSLRRAAKLDTKLLSESVKAVTSVTKSRDDVTNLI